MATHCHNTAGLPDEDLVLQLENYMGERQTEATRLEAVLEAIETLTVENLAPQAVASLITVAAAMASDLSDRLDVVNMRKAGVA